MSTIPFALIKAAVSCDGPHDMVSEKPLSRRGLATLLAKAIDRHGNMEATNIPHLGWCFDVMRGYSEHEPLGALEVIRQCADIIETPSQAAFLAAGPLEDLIADHGEVVIATIESEAKENERFRFLLSGVWPRGQDEEGEVWQRLLRARGSFRDLASCDKLPSK